MAELDRLLRLKRGTSNALRRRGVFEAARMAGRLWGISEAEVPAVRDAIDAYRSGPDEDAETVSVKGAAFRLAVASSTIYNLIRLGRLEAVPVPNGRIHVTIASIEEYRQTRLPLGVGIRLPRGPGRSKRRKLV